MDLPCFGRPVRSEWYKWRWHCPAAAAYATDSFTEVTDEIAPSRSARTCQPRTGADESNAPRTVPAIHPLQVHVNQAPAGVSDGADHRSRHRPSFRRIVSPPLAAPAPEGRVHINWATDSVSNLQTRTE